MVPNSLSEPKSGFTPGWTGGEVAKSQSTRKVLVASGLRAHGTTFPFPFFLFTVAELKKPNRPTQIIYCLGMGECIRREQILSGEIPRSGFQFDTWHQSLTVH